MKITFLVPVFDLSGGLRIVAHYADMLQKRGHEVLVVARPVRSYSWQARLKTLMRGRGWPAQKRQGPSHFDAFDVPCHTLERFRPVTDADVPDADVVVATWWETACWAAALSPRKGVKVHFIQHHEADPLISGAYSVEAEASYRLPLHKIVVSRWLLELMQTRHNDPDVAISPNSVDLDLFHAPPRSKQSRPTVGLLYSKAPMKACEVSLGAIEQVSRQIPDLHLIAFGSHPLVPELPLPTGADYHRSPPQEKIRDLYSRCDVWLCASRGEGFHLPPHEAMACRCPVVSTRVGGPEDMIEDGVNGFLVAVDDQQALADRLHHVLSLPEAQWKQLSDAAHETACAYSWDDATDCFEAALKRAVAKQAGTVSDPLGLDTRG